LYYILTNVGLVNANITIDPKKCYELTACDLYIQKGVV
jgi:hypothetical protein